MTNTKGLTEVHKRGSISTANAEFLRILLNYEQVKLRRASANSESLLNKSTFCTHKD